jgi:HK97 family phage prohead protease
MSNKKIFGYANFYSNKDMHNDVVLKTAFSNVQKKPIKLLFEHDNHSQIGWAKILKVDESGVFIEGLIDDNFNILNAISKGFCGLSIGYYTKSSKKDLVYNTRYISKLNIEEISIVKNPANKKCLITTIV